ncbi:MAG: ATP-dependent RecD-like DNA helicase [Bacteroidia bacterium]
MQWYSFDPNNQQALQEAVEAHLRRFTTDWFGMEPEGEGASDAVSGIRAGFEAEPDDEQGRAIDRLAAYLHEGGENELLILRGSAGTGKTSLMRGLVHYLKSINRPVILLAPTGRAAKVIAARTSSQASTVHRQIYMLEERLDKGGQMHGFSFLLKYFESEEPVVFVVDEASMLSSLPLKEGQYHMNGLLPDLLQHIFASSGWNRLVLVGDPFQLPPVFEHQSAALNQAYLAAMGYQVSEIELNKVKRQRSQSGILQLATSFRDAIHNKLAPEWELEADDIIEIRNTDAALEHYLDLYRRDPESVLFITYSNFWAHKLNVRIRRALHPEAGRLPLPGEQLMVVRNHFLKNRDFLANSETIRIDAMDDEIEDYAGLQWLKIEAAYTDLKGHQQFVRSRMLFDLLNSKEASLGAAQWQLLWRARKPAETFGPLDPYLNALHLKYAYAVTGHKAQGGEWPHVFVLLEKRYGTEAQHLRWLYTAITRASERLYLVHPV